VRNKKRRSRENGEIFGGTSRETGGESENKAWGACWERGEGTRGGSEALRSMEGGRNGESNEKRKVALSLCLGRGGDVMARVNNPTDRRSPVVRLLTLQVISVGRFAYLKVRGKYKHGACLRDRGGEVGLSTRSGWGSLETE